MLAWYLTDMVKHIRNPIGYLLYAQIAVYFGLSFFTTWFSNPTTWFYLAVTGPRPSMWNGDSDTVLK